MAEFVLRCDYAIAFLDGIANVTGNGWGRELRCVVRVMKSEWKVINIYLKEYII